MITGDEYKSCDALFAERAVVGRMLLWPDVAIAPALFSALPEDFENPTLRAAFEVISDMQAAGEPIEILSVCYRVSGRLRGEDFEKSIKAGKMSANDIWVDILECEHSATSATNTEYYAQIVAQHGHLRRLKSEVMQAARTAASVEEATDMLEHAMRRAEISESNRMENIGDVLSREHDDLAAEVEGRKTVHKVNVGLAAIDDQCGGLRGGEFWVFGARPGAGKTVLGWQIAEAVAYNTRNPALFFSLEMSKSELARRMFARNSRSLTTTHIRHAHIPPGAWDEMRSTIIDYEGVPLYVIDEPRMTLKKIVAACERAAMVKYVSIIVVDYLQLIRSDRRNDSREQEVAEMSRELKALARSLDTPVVALAQLNREVEKRASHNPQLSDLRESGAVEQDADTVVFIHRPFLFNAEADQQEAELHILKNRHCAGARIPVQFLGHKSVFLDASPQ